MDIPEVLLPIVVVNVLAWLSPGPNMLAVMSASLSHGRRLGVITGFGMALAALIWAALAMAGVTALFDIFPHLVLLLRVTGAAYLFWLGVKLLRSGLRDAPLAPQPMPPASARRAFLSGFTISMTNPKAALFFGSILTTFVPGLSRSCCSAACLLPFCTASPPLFSRPMRPQPRSPAPAARSTSASARRFAFWAVLWLPMRCAAPDSQIGMDRPCRPRYASPMIERHAPLSLPRRRRLRA